MNVNVEIRLKAPINAETRAHMRFATTQLSNQPKDVLLYQPDESDNRLVVAEFRMNNAAQAENLEHIREVFRYYLDDIDELNVRFAE